MATYVQLGAVRTWYDEHGDGDPLVLMHGGLVDARFFEPNLGPLAERFHVTALDLPGFGESRGPTRPWGTFDYAEFVESFLERIELPKATLVGHSFGGKTSIALASRRPDLVQKLVLVDSAGIVPRRGVGYYARVYLVKAARRLRMTRLVTILPSSV